MPIKSYIDKAKDLTVFEVTGVLSFDMVLVVVKAFYDGVPTKHVLWDFTATTEVRLTSEEIETISNFRLQFEGQRASGKTAFLAQKKILFGLARIFEIQSRFHEAPYAIKVFRSKNEAFRWIEEA